MLAVELDINNNNGMTTPEIPRPEPAQHLLAPVPQSFENTLLDIYAGAYQARSTLADIVHENAIAVVMKTSERETMQDGTRVWATVQYATHLAGDEIRCNLLAPRRPLHFADIGRSVLTLAINGNPSLPAALIIPPRSNRESASIVVGGNVNEREHMLKVDGIINGIRTHSKNRPGWRAVWNGFREVL